jgi:hypothetical protein
LVPPRTSVAYVQTILSDVARASPQLVPPLISHVCHHSGPDLFLCGYKFIIACTSQLRLIVRHVVTVNNFYYIINKLIILTHDSH